MLPLRIELDLENLNSRPYIHGTSIVKGVIAAIDEGFGLITDFEIRLKRKLVNNPTFLLSYEKNSLPVETVVTGSFTKNKQKAFFALIDEGKPCAKVLTVDEVALSTRIYESETNWLMNLRQRDDIHVCLNEVSKVSNQALFAAQPGIVISPEKQTWFVGYKLPSLEFLSHFAYVVGVSKAYRMLTPTCMVRQIIVNDRPVGERICIYA